MENNSQKQNNLPVGFFDSGVGGLSVFAEFKRLMPNEDTVYIGDLVHLPYGNKSKEQLISYARTILKFFEKQNVKAVVIACNTSSAQAYDTIKNEFNFKIYPIIQSCAKVIASLKVDKIGVFATEATVQSKAYTKELKQHNPNLQILEIACPNWVNIVENGLINTSQAREDVKNHIDAMNNFSPDKIILGCTHYPYLTKILSEFVDEKVLIDPAKVFVKYIRDDFEKSNLLNQQKTAIEKFFVTSSPEQFFENSKLFYSVKSLPEVLKL